MAAGWAHPDLLVDTDWLAAHLNDPRPPRGRLRRSNAYFRLHLPGAVPAPCRYWKGDGNDTDIFGIEGEKFAALIGKLGIGNHHTVVAYDNSGNLFATRLWWTLDRYGHNKCRVLDGGLDKWHAEGRPLPVNARVPRPDLPAPARQRSLELGTIQGVGTRSNDPGHLLWDVRTDAEWTGANKRGAKRGGRVPGAVHLEWSELLNHPVRTFKSPEEVRTILTQHGITPDKAVTTY